jgi:large subunit ribosomal protein L20
LIHGLRLANVSINRKMLSELAVNDPNAFASYVELAKKHLKNVTA